MPAPEIWIGLAEVRHRPGAGVLLDRNTAYTNALALARDSSEFEEVVREAAAKIGFDLITVEECEPLRARLVHHTISTDLEELAQEVSASGTPRFGTFFTWISES